MNLYTFSGHVIELWNQWELRIMILLSLSLQIFLTITGSRRKYTAGIWFGRFVWLAYLSADWLATITLGILARSLGGSESKGTTSSATCIPAFWAPMLLVHLGGPDAITAYSIEDNELWSRHLLQLLTQLVVAFYASFRSWWSNDPLIYIVIPIFVSGVIKYGERIWVLWIASSNKFRYCPNTESFYLLVKGNDEIPEARYIQEAHSLFQTLKLLFADYPVTFAAHRKSDALLRSKTGPEAFKLVEIELGFMFDLLFTKVITTVRSRLRIILRCINFLSTVSALVAFSSMTRNSHTYTKIDIIISYLLLIGAIVLEIYSAILMLFSDWAMLWLSKRRVWWSRSICSSRLLSFLRSNRRWKASTAQSVIEEHRVSLCKYISKLFRTGHIQSWEDVGDDLKKFIFKSLLSKSSRCSFEDAPIRILAERGGRALRSYDYNKELGWSVQEKDFHESFLMWHMAVNNCFEREYSRDPTRRDLSISLSRYMMYLWEDLPFMLPKQLGEPKYKQAVSDGDMKEGVAKLIDSFKGLERKYGLSVEQKWEITSDVLVEMLFYAASQCGWKEHAKALSRGGELLTFVAVLMSHLGLHRQCMY
ncbi:hypothetical protein NC651_014840 [Populus alba x Populus x berolinensis]|nr:hypothetical protein NC651_014840 [Populus alba x Populus x berolinensis]